MERARRLRVQLSLLFDPTPKTCTVASNGSESLSPEGPQTLEVCTLISCNLGFRAPNVSI